MKKLPKKIVAFFMAMVLCIPTVAVAHGDEGPPPMDGELVFIDDGAIRVTVDEEMSMTVYRWDGEVMTAMTKKIEPVANPNAVQNADIAWDGVLPWSAATGTGNSDFQAGSAKILSDKSGYVTGGTRVSNDAFETLLADDFVRTEAVYEENVNTYFGTGNRLTITGFSESAALERKVVMETGNVPGAVAVSSHYTYKGEEDALTVAKFVEHNYKIEDEKPEMLVENGAVRVKAGLWTLQGSPTTWSADQVIPVFDTMGAGRNVDFDVIDDYAKERNGHVTWDSPISGNLKSTGNGMKVRNNWFWSGNAGYAYNDYYGTTIGIGIGSIMPHHTYSLELPTRGSAIAGNHETAYTWVGWPGKELKKDVEEYVGTSLVAVHTGDYFEGANMYARVMDEVNPELLKLPTTEELPSWEFEPIWESWGYGETMAPENIFDMIPLLKELGIKSITYDAGWYDRSNAANAEGVYKPLPSKWAKAADKLSAYFAENPHPAFTSTGDPAFDFSELPCTTPDEAVRVVRALNEYIHVNDMFVTAWSMQPIGKLGEGGLMSEHPDYYAIDKDGRYQQLESASNLMLCTGNPGVLDDYTDYFCDLHFGTGMYEYNFDGLKGDSFWGAPLCYAEGHGHDGDIYASIKGYGQFFKNIYDKANYMRGATEYVGGPIVDVERVAVMKNCCCGSAMDYFTFPGTNRPLAGDHVGSRQNRYISKIYRGFYGADFPVDSDHHQLDFSGRNSGPVDFTSILGTGLIFATKFITDKYNPYTGTNGTRMQYPEEATYADMPVGARAYKWGDFVKYYGLYQDLRIVDSEYLSLYKYGIDYPEAYAYETKDGDRYYSFYATSFAVDAEDAGAEKTANYYKNMGASGAVAMYDLWTNNNYENPDIYEGAVEMRGLNPGANYTITNVETGEKLSGDADANGNIILTGVEFRTGIIYHVSQTPTSSIFGVVTDGENPVAGATLVIYKDGEQLLAPTASNLKGEYSFPIVPEGINEYYDVVVTHPNYGDKTETGVTGEQNGKELNIVLEPPVELPEVYGVTITPGGEIDMEKGAIQVFEAVVETSEGENNDVLWSLEGAENEGTSIDEDGVLHIDAEETAATLTVKAASRIDPEKYDTVTVHLVAEFIEVGSVKIDSAAITVIKVKDQIQLNCTVNPSEATNTEITWQSSNANVATVDENGYVKALSAGMITISATAHNGKTSQIILRVTY